MPTTTAKRSVTRGGGFLVESCAPQDLFTPADLSDDHKLIGQTAEEFATKEVLPLATDLELHKEGLMAGLLKQSAELGLLAGGVPEAYGGLGLDKVSTTIMSEKLAVYASFAVSHGGHAGIGTLPIVYFGTEE
ncbi:MAG: acyl-CoA dehydrogenase family protein, partial [Candidatus Acidiferrales bacterium]